MGKYTYHDFLAHFGVGAAHPGGLALTKELLKGEKITSSSKVIDVGCGTGKSAAYLVSTYGCEVTAIEPHPVMLQKASQRFVKEKVQVHLVQGSSERIPVPSNSFDFLLAESVTVFTNILASLKEYARVLRPGGIAIDVDMTAGHPFTSGQLREFTKLYGIMRVPTEVEWKKIGLRAGFRKVKVVKSVWVDSALKKSGVISEETPELDPSPSLDPDLYDIWGNHQSLTEKYAGKLKYGVYRFTK